MERVSIYFLKILGAFVKGETIEIMKMSGEEWEKLYELARKQKLETAVYETIFTELTACQISLEIQNRWQKRARNYMVREVRKLERFWRIYEVLKRELTEPIVVKGVLCRFLYPSPYARPSGDEDLYLWREQIPHCEKILTELGMVRQSRDGDGAVTFQDRYSALHLEIHVRRAEFAQVIRQEVEGHTVWTLPKEEHLWYLLIHLVKHLTGAGVGIRQVCDFTLFIQAYGQEVDWVWFGKRLEKAKLSLFCANLLSIGMEYFALERTNFSFSEEWLLKADPEALLEEMLDAGIYGSESLHRLHSSGITRAESLLFPPKERLLKRCPYLKRYPWLLPAAWVQRLAGYGWEVVRGREDSPSRSIALGRQRRTLLKKYGVIP